MNNDKRYLKIMHDVFKAIKPQIKNKDKIYNIDCRGGDQKVEERIRVRFK